MTNSEDPMARCPSTSNGRPLATYYALYATKPQQTRNSYLLIMIDDMGVPHWASWVLSDLERMYPCLRDPYVAGVPLANALDAEEVFSDFLGENFKGFVK
jgi:hypothetical protein